jgi:hypothetical protein
MGTKVGDSITIIFPYFETTTTIMWQIDHNLHLYIQWGKQVATHFTYEYPNKNTKPKKSVYYKVMPGNMHCKGLQYEIGKTYTIPNRDLQICKRGFHACKHPIDCSHYYDFTSENRYFRVKMLGEIRNESKEYLCKSVTDKMKIATELSYEDWLKLCTVTTTYWYKNVKLFKIQFIKGEKISVTGYWSNGNIKSIYSSTKFSHYKQNGIISHTRECVENGFENTWLNTRFIDGVGSVTTTDDGDKKSCSCCVGLFEDKSYRV